MGGPLAALAFGVGAGLGLAAVRTVAGGMRPVLRGTLKTGLLLADTAGAAAARATDALGRAVAEAREEQGRIPTGGKRRQNRSRSAGPELRKIPVVRE